jgi:outer membrane immunogenic protein
MKKLLLSGAALLALVGAANAADLPVRAPAPYAAPAVVPPPATWTGFYVGGGWGYGLWDMSSNATTLGVAQGTTNNAGRGWLGQAVAGYDYQFALGGWNLVVGAFGDYSFGNMTGTSSILVLNPTGSLTGVEKETSFWDVGARGGLLITPEILTYFNGGYSSGHFDGINMSIGPVPLSTSSHNYGGWFTGGGVETKIQSIPGLFFNTEYRVMSYNSSTQPIAGSTALGTGTINLKQQPYVQTVMSGIRYKFNWQ